jgi:hypothetical protein
MMVNWGPDYRYLVSYKPDIVSFNLVDAASTMRAAAERGHVPNGMDQFYQAVQRSDAWRPGPTFGPYRIFVKNTEQRINTACR